VQNLLGRHVEILQKFSNVTRELYLAYATLYYSSSNMIAYFQGYTENMPGYIAAAMQVYAEKNLS